MKEPIIVTVPMTMTEAEANEYGNVNYETAKEDKNYSGKWYFYECLYEITNNAKPGMGLMKEKIKVTLPFTMTFNEALRYKNVKFSTAKEDINYTGKWYRLPGKLSMAEDIFARIENIIQVIAGNISYRLR